MKLGRRIQWLDFAKGLTILSVVLVHSLYGSDDKSIIFKFLEYFLLIFAMPLFFAISGFLYKPANNFRKYIVLLYKKMGSFILPYIIFTFADVVIFHITINHSIFSNFYRIYFIPVGYLWFLYSLFFIFIIVGLMDLCHINLSIQICVSIILMILQIYLPWQMSEKGNMNPLSGIGGYMICFYLGYLIKRFNLINILKNKSIYIILSLIWISLIIIQYFITGNNYNTNIFTYYDIITKLLSIPVFFSIFINFNHDSLFKYFDKYGKCTLIIYLVHLPIISVVGKIMTKISLNNSILMFIALIVLGWYLSIFACYLAKRIKWINFVFYPRKYIDKVVLKTKWGRRLLIK